jgi:hypothetical protein
MNRVFNMDVDTLANCLLEHGDFLKNYWAKCKYYDIKCTEWKAVDSAETRNLEFSIDLGAIGKPRNFEEQKVILKEPKKRFVMLSQAYSTGIMYSDYFTIICKYCITKCSAKTSSLFVNLYLDYKKQPNFVVKGIIEKNMNTRSRECLSCMEKLLEEEQALFANKSSSSKNTEIINIVNSNKTDTTETNSFYNISEKIVHIEQKND